MKKEGKGERERVLKIDPEIKGGRNVGGGVRRILLGIIIGIFHL